MIQSILAIMLAIIGFGFLILWHELGHFIFAKLNGVLVEEFAIGMGKQLFSIKGKETQYSIRMLPIGGYVKMYGEAEEIEDSANPRAFTSKSAWQRLSIIAAGPIFNLILAVVLFGAVFMMMGTVVPTISELTPDAPAIEAGLEVGDEIVRIDDTKVNTWSDFTAYMLYSEGEPVEVEVIRSGEMLKFNITPELIVEETGERYIVGVSPSIVTPGFFEALKLGYDETVSTIKQVFMFFGQLFSGEVAVAESVGGPVTIMKVSYQIAMLGVINMLVFMAFMSVQLGIFNLIPFPALDGGWIFILLIEAVTRRKIPEKYVNTLNYIGFMALMGLMLLVTIKDILFPVAL